MNKRKEREEWDVKKRRWPVKRGGEEGGEEERRRGGEEGSKDGGNGRQKEEICCPSRTLEHYASSACGIHELQGCHFQNTNLNNHNMF